MRVAIVGAGAVGLAVAEALSARGVDVVVFEAGQVGAGASAGNAGWITPSLAAPIAAPGVITGSLRWLGSAASPLWIRPTLEPALVAWLARFALASRRRVYERGLAALQLLSAQAGPAYDRLAERGARFEQHREPLLYPAFDDRELGDLRHAARALAAARAPMSGVGSRNVPVACLSRPLPAEALVELSAAEVRGLEPALGPEVRGGMLASGESRVRPESLTAALVARLEERGVSIHTGAAVSAIARDGGGWRLTTRTAGEHRATHVVLANGVGARRLLRPHGAHLPILTAKGYSRTYPAADGDGAPRRALYLEGPRVAISPFQGALRLSGTLELGARRLALSPARLEAITAAARRALPGWAAPGPAADWAGMRVVSPDGLPFIGPIPGLPGAHVSTAHGMLGITLAPLSAEIIAGRLLDGRDDPLTRAVDPVR